MLEPPQSFCSVGNEKDGDKDNRAMVLSPASQNNVKSVRQSSPGAPRKCLQMGTGVVLAKRTLLCMHV